MFHKSPEPAYAGFLYRMRCGTLEATDHPFLRQVAEAVNPHAVANAATLATTAVGLRGPTRLTYCLRLDDPHSAAPVAGGSATKPTVLAQQGEYRHASVGAEHQDVGGGGGDAREEAGGLSDDEFAPNDGGADAAATASVAGATGSGRRRQRSPDSRRHPHSHSGRSRGSMPSRPAYLPNLEFARRVATANGCPLTVAEGVITTDNAYHMAAINLLMSGIDGDTNRPRPPVPRRAQAIAISRASWRAFWDDFIAIAQTELPRVRAYLASQSLNPPTAEFLTRAVGAANMSRLIDLHLAHQYDSGSAGSTGGAGGISGSIGLFGPLPISNQILSQERRRTVAIEIRDKVDYTGLMPRDQDRLLDEWDKGPRNLNAAVLPLTRLAGTIGGVETVHVKERPGAHFVSAVHIQFTHCRAARAFCAVLAAFGLPVLLRVPVPHQQPQQQHPHGRGGRGRGGRGGRGGHPLHSQPATEFAERMIPLRFFSIELTDTCPTRIEPPSICVPPHPCYGPLPDPATSSMRHPHKRGGKLAGRNEPAQQHAHAADVAADGPFTPRWLLLTPSFDVHGAIPNNNFKIPMRPRSRIMLIRSLIDDLFNFVGATTITPLDEDQEAIERANVLYAQKKAGGGAGPYVGSGGPKGASGADGSSTSGGGGAGGKKAGKKAATMKKKAGKAGGASDANVNEEGDDTVVGVSMPAVGSSEMVMMGSAARTASSGAFAPPMTPTSVGLPQEELRFEEDTATDAADGAADGGSSAGRDDDVEHHDDDGQVNEAVDEEGDAFIFQENPDAFSFEDFNAPNDDDDDDDHKGEQGGVTTATAPASPPGTGLAKPSPLPPLPAYRPQAAEGAQTTATTTGSTGGPGSPPGAADDAAAATARDSTTTVTAAARVSAAATADGADASTSVGETKRAQVPPEGYLIEFRCYEDARVALHLLQRPLLTRYALVLSFVHRAYRLAPLRQPPLVL